jgi:cytochrome P450
MDNTIKITVVVLCIAISCILWGRSKSPTSALSRSNKCLPPPQYPLLDPIFGLDIFFRNAKAISENRSLPTLQERHAKMGWTFGSLSFGTTAIASIEPENLKTVWVTKFEDWGVQPTRLPAMGPFVGRGFLTMDGPEWEHSRALLKPSLRKAQIANLDTFEESLQLMIDKIPTDGSTVDLQSLYLVSSVLIPIKC